MRHLLDSHILLWHFAAPDRLSTGARSVLAAPESELVVSVVSLWELCLKASLGKLDGPRPFLPHIESRLEALGARVLLVEIDHVRCYESLPRLHGDPFDRMLAAQAISQGLTLITADEKLRRYPVPILWAGA